MTQQQQIQRRLFRHKCEIRNADSRTIGGVAIPFNSPQVLYPGFSELWLPGSVTYHESGVKLLYFHDKASILASTKTERLRLSLTDEGLLYEADLPNTSLGDDMLALIALGEVDGVSPGFVAQREKMSYDPATNGDTRSMLSAMVFEISLTHMSGYPDTSIEQRNSGEHNDHAEMKARLDRQRTIERVARESVLLKLKHKG